MAVPQFARPQSYTPRGIADAFARAMDQLEAYLRTLGSGSSPLTTKGDVFGFDSGNARIPIGADTQVLTADSAQTLGLKWAAPAGGPPTGGAGGDLSGTYPNPTIKASVGLTGTPTAPTAAVDTTTTQIATTAYVIGQAATGPGDLPIVDGTATVGTSKHYARADHIHPTDTSRRASNDFTGEHDPGNLTVASNCFLEVLGHLDLTSTENLQLVGTAELVLEDFGPYAPTKIILGTPRVPTLPFTVPTDYFLEVNSQLALVGVQAATLEGTAELVMSDDFGTRSSITLAGRG